MTLEEIIKQVDKIEGWFYPSQMTTLYPIIKDLDSNGLIVEIGTYYGRSTRFFSLANPGVKIVTIDEDPKALEKGNIFQVVGKSGVVAKGSALDTQES